MKRPDSYSTEGKARLWVLVFDRSGTPFEATVESRSESDREYSPVPYDPSFQRHVRDSLEPGPIDLQIRGPEHTAPEQRTVNLKPGDNHVSVMVAEPGMPAIQTPDGPWYFESLPGRLLLHITGEQAWEKTVAILGDEVRYRSVTTTPAGAQDDVLLEIDVGTGPDCSDRLRHIDTTIVTSLRDAGLQAQTSLPAYVSGEVAFGITGEIIIQFASSATTEDIQALAKEFGLEQVRHIAWMGNAFLFRDPEGPCLRLLDHVEAIRHNSLVVLAEPNVTNRIQTFGYTPTDYLYPETPHLGLIEADDAWQAIETLTAVPRGGSPDIVIGVVDPSGVDPNHPDLSGPLTDGSPKQVANFDFVTMSTQTVANLPYDHGTQCAGSAAGNFDNTVGNCGVAPNCRLIGARMSATAPILTIADIWVWMAGFPTGSPDPAFPAPPPKGADVISNSWGGFLAMPNLGVMQAAFDFLTTYPRNGRGIVMVFAVGNFGFASADTRNSYAADPRTLSVGASINVNPTNPVDSINPDPANNTVGLAAVVDTRSYFSPYGMTLDLVAPSNTCFGLAFNMLTFADFVDPIMAPVRSGRVVTTMTAPRPAGDTVLPVASTAGFQQGSILLIGAPSDPVAELRIAQAVAGASITVTQPLTNAHPAGTFVSNRPADWPSSAVTSTVLTAGVVMGATSLPVASTAGFTAGAIVAVGAPGMADTETTTVVSVAAGTLTVTALQKNHPSGTTVATGPAAFAMNAFIGFGGTSHACPTVAGAAALVLSVKPDLNWLEVHAILQNSATRIDPAQPSATGQWVDLDGDGTPEFSQWYGRGRLNVYDAVTQAITLSNRTDAIVRDNLADTGLVPSVGWHAESPDIWVRSTNDPIPVLAYMTAPPHENPRAGQDNWVYLRVRNGGTTVARRIFLRASIAHFPGIEFVYPDDWQPSPRLGAALATPLTPGSYLIGQVEVNDLAPGANQIVKLLWPQNLIPPETVTIGGTTVNWHPCLLLEAAPHDGPATISGLAYPVKGDNNIAHRNIAIRYSSRSRRMNGIVAGTRDRSGVDALILDRTAIPAGIHVVLKTSDSHLMRHWADLIRSGSRFVSRAPLGTTSRLRTDGDLIDTADEQRMKVTLLDRTRIAVEDASGNIMAIDAAARTRFTMIAASQVYEKTNTDSIQLANYHGEPVLSVDHTAGAVLLPMRLAANEWKPIFVGIDTAGEKMQPTGSLRVSQLRGDGTVSPGFEIAV